MGRRDLVKDIWPDKALFGATLLFLTALLGVLHGAAMSAVDITFGDRLPGWLVAYPAWLTLLMSAGAAVAAYMSLKRRSIRLGVVGGVLGVLSFGLLGLGSLLALIALIFVAASKAEGEHVGPADEAIAPEMWPDKALAASVVLVVAGVLTLAWAYGLSSDLIAFQGYTGDPATFGLIAGVLGLVCIISAVLLYFQRGRWLAVVACIGGLLSLGLYVVVPLLSLIALVLVYQAWRENEFQVPP